MIIWIPPEHLDCVVECSKTGEIVRVIKGNVRIKKILEDHRDNPKNELTAANKIRFNSIHRVNQR